MGTRKIISLKKKKKKIAGNMHVETGVACYIEEKNPSHLTLLPPNAFIRYLVYKILGLLLISRHGGALKYLIQ